MDKPKPRELYHEEISNLENFKAKIDTHAIYKEDIEIFTNQYEELVAQAKVITRVSDRLQKKLDNANVQIREQNEEIKDKNTELEVTIDQLVVAKVGRRASTIMLTVALVLFIIEQIVLQPVLDQYIESLQTETNSIPLFLQPILNYLDLLILGALFIVVKSLESGLENYFLSQEKKKILQKERMEHVHSLR